MSVLTSDNLSTEAFGCPCGSCATGTFVWKYPSGAITPITFADNNCIPLFENTTDGLLYKWTPSSGTFEPVGGTSADARSYGAIGNITALNGIVPSPVVGDTAYLIDSDTVSGGVSGTSANVWFNGTNWVVYDLDPAFPVVADARFKGVYATIPTLIDLPNDGDTGVQNIAIAGGVVRDFYANVGGTITYVGSQFVDIGTERQFGNLRLHETTGNWGLNVAPSAIIQVQVLADAGETAIAGFATNATGVQGISTSSMGGNFSSTSGIGLQGSSAGNFGARSLRTNVLAGTYQPSLLIESTHVSTTNNNGTGYEMRTNGIILANAEYRITDATAGAQSSLYRLRLQRDQVSVGATPNVNVAEFDADYLNTGVTRASFFGDVFYTGALIPSDERLKDWEKTGRTDSFTFWKDGTAYTFKLDFVRFKWNGKYNTAKSDRWQYGYIAQHVEKAFMDMGLDAFEEGVLNTSYVKWIDNVLDSEYPEYVANIFELDQKIVELSANEVQNSAELEQLRAQCIAHYEEDYKNYLEKRNQEATETRFLALTDVLSQFKD